MGKESGNHKSLLLESHFAGAAAVVVVVDSLDQLDFEKQKVTNHPFLAASIKSYHQEESKVVWLSDLLHSMI